MERTPQGFSISGLNDSSHKFYWDLNFELTIAQLGAIRDFFYQLANKPNHP